MRIAYRQFLLPLMLLGAFGATGTLESQEIRVKHILLRSEDEAKGVQAEINKNGLSRAAFSKAARRHSKDTTTRVLGGDLGFVGQSSSLDKLFLKEAFDLEPGQMSQPVQTSFGWHLIYVVERRGPPPTPLVNPPTPAAPDADNDPHAGHDHAGHDHAGHDHDHSGHDHPHGDENKAPQASTTDLVPTPPASSTSTPTVSTEPRPDAKRRTLLETSFRVRLETVNSARHFPRHHVYQPEEAVEINLSVKNESSTDQKFPAPELLPLGLKLSKEGQVVAGDFSDVAEPASLMTTLKTYQIAGLEVSLNAYFPGIDDGRFTLNWDAQTFFDNLEARFPKAKEEAGYAALKTTLTATRPRNPIAQDVVMRDRSQRVRVRERDGMDLAVFPNMRPTQKYYARLQIQGEKDPVVIELHTDKQFRAAKHFADLVLEGFYDQLSFFEIRDGDYLLGGDPLSNGTGAPARLLTTRNIGKLTHSRGTVSFVSRSVRGQGPVSGGQVGSIFFVSLKEHPEWDEEHVPFGQVIAGLNVLEKIGGKQTARFQDITILDESQFGQLDVPAAPAGDVGGEGFTTGNPQLTVKTSKGSLSVELFEDTAPNTVAHFVRMAEDGKYDARKFFYVLMDAGGTERMAIQSGSPNDDFDGDPGYTIPDEYVARRKHVIGSLVMVRKYDPDASSYVKDSAGSQFIICLRDIPAYDQVGSTVFGQVTGGLDVLSKLDVDDTIESVTVDKKKNRAYTFRKS